jgi:hypothetical protein
MHFKTQCSCTPGNREITLKGQCNKKFRVFSSPVSVYKITAAGVKLHQGFSRVFAVIFIHAEKNLNIFKGGQRRIAKRLSNEDPENLPQLLNLFGLTQQKFIIFY